MSQKQNEVRMEETEKRLTDLDKKVEGMAVVLSKIAISVMKLLPDSEESKKREVESMLTASSSHVEFTKNKGKENVAPVPDGWGGFYLRFEDWIELSSNDSRCRFFVVKSRTPGYIRQKHTSICIN